ncbi:LuxR family transcriptional regulator [Acidisoma cellulosilytica]|uniref:LuxR family transcriptional regulator n=1 Tax=Acidisoma cellulosilyticum TaxID=2802395 RepID=A0A963Z3J7_9PROT|nr:LuxR family transcriptional regulator [Acidisoma cellulosilyticum]MCB8881330.1 LuxR family transcriptional regulator [Acidisoma cellulosilyticum]
MDQLSRTSSALIEREGVYDFDAMLDEIDSIRSVGDLEAHLTGLSQRLGFTYFSYVLADRRHLDGEASGQPMFLTSYPSKWRNRYRRQDYHTVDTVVTRGQLERKPFFWGDKPYLRELSGHRRRLFDEARDFGIQSGFTVPIHGPLGECSLFSVSTSGPMAELETAVKRCRYFLQILGPKIHAAAMENLVDDGDRQAIRLTDHERICLSWTVQGKTAWEIAQIIGRSKPTVEYHLQKAIKKLGATNKLHAAFRAVRLGLM